VYLINSLKLYEDFLDFNAKVGMKNIFKPTIGNDTLCKLIMLMEL
jgi:hypothetical protein